MPREEEKTDEKVKTREFNECFILGVFDKQPRYEVFGQDAGAAEELLVECVIHGRHVGQSLLLVVSQERRGPAQTEGWDGD